MGRIYFEYLTNLRKRCNTILERVDKMNKEVPNNHLLLTRRPTAIDLGNLTALDGVVSFYDTLDVVTKIQRQVLETRGFLRYVEVSFRFAHYSAESMPDETDVSPNLLMSSPAFIGIWANGMHIWDLVWYTRVAKVPVFFAADIPPVIFFTIQHRALRFSYFERTYAQCFQHDNTTPYTSLHRRYRTSCHAIDQDLDYARQMGLPSFSVVCAVDRLASSLLQGYTGMISPSVTFRMGTLTLDRSRQSRLWEIFHNYVSAHRTPLVIQSSQSSSTSEGESWTSEGMGPWDNT